MDTHQRTPRRDRRPHAASRQPTLVNAGPERADDAVRLRRRLLAKAPLFDDAVAYAAGVDDALTACATAFGLDELLEALAEPGFPTRF